MRRRWSGRDIALPIASILIGLFATPTPAHEAAPQPSSSRPDQVATAQTPLKELSLEDLLQVEVTTVSRTESTLGRSPAAVHVITQEDIRRSGATTFPELFRKVPGMNVARIEGNKWAVGVRGFNDRFANKLLVQVDGRTVYNPLFSGVFWDAVDYPLEDIERIEVIRGPGAAVWGANAFNGIINILTRSAKDTQGGLISGGGGTTDRGLGTFRYGGTISNLSYRVYVKGLNSDEQFSREGNPEDGWWGTSTGLRLDWQAGQRDAVTFQADYVHSVAGRLDRRAMIDPPFVLTNVEDDVTDDGYLLARWTRTLDNNTSWSLQVFGDRFQRKSRGVLNLLDLRWDTYDVDFQYQFPLGKRHELVSGWGYRFVDATLKPSRSDGGFAVTWLRPHRRTQLGSAFVQDQITLWPETLSITLGSKLEHNGFTGVEVQPTGRLLWTPSTRQSTWFAVSRAVRTPNLQEDEIQLTLLPVSTAPPIFPRLIGNRDLQSEELLAYELGYRAQTADLLAVDFALFYNVYSNLRVGVPGRLTPGSAPGALIAPVFFDNGMNGEAYGAEIGANWSPNDRQSLYGAYTFLETRLRADSRLSEANRTSTEAIADQSPKHQLYLQSSWNLPRNVAVDVIGRFVDRLRGFNPGGAPGVANVVDQYVALDARASRRLRNNLEVAVVGQNLLHSHHPEFGTSALVRSPLVEIERSVYGKVTWLF